MASIKIPEKTLTISRGTFGRGPRGKFVVEAHVKDGEKVVGRHAVVVDGKVLRNRGGEQIGETPQAIVDALATLEAETNALVETMAKNDQFAREVEDGAVARSAAAEPKGRDK